MVSPALYTDPRFGLHYFPDTLHYRAADLQTWLPELQDLGASWLVLCSELGRAIPEPFLMGLKQVGIEPLIQFPLSLDCLPDMKEISILLEVYARWGARYVIFYDRPNDRQSWPASGWVQQDLVERFLDRYLPAANLALQAGLTPAFPPLMPGGSYWDTAFLRSALEAMQRRKQETLLQKMALSAYAWAGPNASKAHSLNWGAGGPERWSQSRPYTTPTGGQDQCGFRIFDWYQSIAASVLHHTSPVILLQAGLPGDPQSAAVNCATSPDYFATCTAIARLLAGEKVTDPLEAGKPLEPIPSQVISCNFWLLGASANSPYAGQAWFEGKGKRHKLAEAIRAWRRESALASAASGILNNAAGLSKAGAEKLVPSTGPSISHYLLLPGFEWGVSDWYLEVIRPFVKKHRPTIGFSPEEAGKAARVTIVGNSQNYPEDLLKRLQSAGCLIEQISGDGTNIASELAER